MQVTNIYDHYHVPPILRTHMYSVAALAMHVINNLSHPIDTANTHLVVQACLLHDVGNIVKFDLDNSDLLIKEDAASLSKLKEEFAQRFGADDHEATIAMLKELNVSQEVLDVLIPSRTMEEAFQRLKSDARFGYYFYADFRVAPTGVVSLDDRVDELLARYRGRDGYLWADKERAEASRVLMKAHEHTLQKQTTIDIASICNEDIAVTSQSLFSYPIDLNPVL
ncbi:MAG: hypothetical protein UZ22_OP11002000471 [Microgenomates bacterium OLB23]|nr:MAG: hypothetical protein UZ22_OP11002000471 [Microgenomates bacterium OLB23]